MKKYIVITLSAVACVVIYAVSYIEQGNRATKKAYVEYKNKAESYLNEKYFENMICTTYEVSYGGLYGLLSSGVPFYDGVFTYKAFPENNPNCKFVVRYSPSKYDSVDDYYEDFYLTRALTLDARTLVQDIVNRYYSQAVCDVVLKDSLDFNDKLLDYYTANKKPLNWADSKQFDWVNGDIVIHLLEYSEDIVVDETSLKAIVNDIQTLGIDFNMKNIEFFIARNLKEPKTKIITYSIEDNQWLERFFDG
ncbi:hypothetical protein FACS1894188_10370 [Clostridia bacterium]|nr:hypothetical protein FACS1894188_10370 [Clostridia bacterium]